MNRRIIFIILGALLILALIALLWFWFLGRQPQPSDNDDFGTGGNRPVGSTDTGGQTGNGQVAIGSNTTTGVGTTDAGVNDVNTVTPLPGIGGIADIGDVGGIGGVGDIGSVGDVGGIGSVGGVGSIGDVPVYTAPGVTWFDGGALKNFNPTPINQVNTVNLSGTPYITNSTSGGNGDDDGSGIGLGGALGGAAAGLAACTVGLLGGIPLSGSVTAANEALVGVGAASGIYVSDHVTHQILTNIGAGELAVQGSESFRTNFLDCITRGIAKIAIEQITASTVDWINSGFDGKPAFIQDYKQFFTDIADQSAGSFIEGSALSFLCSPIQLQVRIAIAQSYARSRSAPESCTLSDVVGNIEDFMDGNFSDGGWRGLLAVTTEPTNNPFGAYMYGKGLLRQAIAYDQQTATLRISPGGFLSKTKSVCDPFSGECRDIIETPGSAIEDSLRKVMGNSIDSLNLADNFDEVIGALVQQLMTKVLYQGLSNLSGQNGYEDTFVNPLDAQAMAAAQQLLTNLQGAVAVAQQYGSVQQGSISDIQNAQAQLVSLENCWSAAGDTSKASSAEARATNLEARIIPYNANITRANSAITKIQQLHTSLLSATSLADVQAVATQLTAAQNSSQLIVPSDLTSAQQNRTTLQSELASLNQQTSSEMNQCNASR
ncbi:hypothetical protein H7X87_04545 [Acetobacteraceae bacterium]|nr:hypothetical protein [Candidatus Parcubacteria bacterium]